MAQTEIGGLTLALGGLAGAVEARLASWAEDGFARRLWKKDPTLWAEEPLPAELVDRSECPFVVFEPEQCAAGNPRGYGPPAKQSGVEGRRGIRIICGQIDPTALSAAWLRHCHGSGSGAGRIAPAGGWALRPRRSSDRWCGAPR
mgnify:CR=1 FL=1